MRPPATAPFSFLAPLDFASSASGNSSRGATDETAPPSCWCASAQGAIDAPPAFMAASFSLYPFGSTAAAKGIVISLSLPTSLDCCCCACMEGDGVSLEPAVNWASSGNPRPCAFPCGVAPAFVCPRRFSLFLSLPPCLAAAPPRTTSNPTSLSPTIGSFSRSRSLSATAAGETTLAPGMLPFTTYTCCVATGAPAPDGVPGAFPPPTPRLPPAALREARGMAAAVDADGATDPTLWVCADVAEGDWWSLSPLSLSALSRPLISPAVSPSLAPLPFGLAFSFAFFCCFNTCVFSPWVYERIAGSLRPAAEIPLAPAPAAARSLSFALFNASLSRCPSICRREPPFSIPTSAPDGVLV
mmetsp:Transcript_45104/g.88928  ORF Transcript_45104/g.88928 Transcript_45104/m.88928 type:complete len:357 (-) Transcript_45104:393-1463(-)